MDKTQQDSTEELDLRDTVAAAMEEATAAEAGSEDTTQAPEAEAPISEAAAGRERDDKGRFKPKDSEEPQQPPAEEAQGAAPQQQQQAPEGTWNQDKAPTSWSPKARERWSEIPEDLRKEIVRREEAAVMGVRQLQSQYAPLQEVVNGIGPILQEAQQLGVNGVELINRTMATERALRSGSVADRFQVLLGIADQYGVGEHLRKVINESVGRQVLAASPQQHKAQIDPAVAQELQAMRDWRTRMEQETASNYIEQFATANNAEFLPDVRELMADYIERGYASTLEAAYDMACWAHPEIREILKERAGQQQAATKMTQRQAAAAKVSIPNTAKIDVVADDDADDVLSDVKRAVREVSGSRI